MNMFRLIPKSKFVRSIFLQVLAIFIIVGIAIVVIVFFSFSSEINKNVIADKQKQLAVIEDAVSKRADEITSIAYNVGEDPAFYIEPVSGENYTSYEMANILSRYLIGNNFIEYLAYYRLSEPDKIYTSSGELKFSDFWTSYLDLDEKTAAEYMKKIKGTVSARIVPLYFGNASESYFAYTCPLPQFSKNPQAFVLMLIPMSEVDPIMASQLMDSYGKVAVFDDKDRQIYSMSTMDEDKDISIDPDQYRNMDKEEYVKVNGKKYVVQKKVSDTNGWTYISVIRLDDIVSGLASKQLIFIILLLLLMFAAIIVMLIGIIKQYRPISNLAEAVTDKSEDSGLNKIIDEGTLLSSTFATLKDDSEQKQKFETAYYEAEAANKAKSTFLSNMSHDIRTPMNAIIGMTAIASKHSNDPKYVRECLQKVQIASQYLLDIINNVLDMSKIESGRFELSEGVIELSKFIGEIDTILKPNVEEKSQKLIIEIDKITNDKVIGDNVRLMQVFVNILSNAVKFTPEGGTISLYVKQTESSEEGYGNYIFIFADTGIGMPDEFVDQVFDTFSRANDRAVSKAEGTGLGMAIAKNLVKLMGGTIKCESELGKGTTFTVTMHMKLTENYSEPESRKDIEKYESSSGGSNEDVLNLEGKRILVVEDNILNREIACKIISETNADYSEAADGKEAIEIFASHKEGYFDIILMDLQMPVMNGYEAVAKIRALQRADAKTVPVYAMTANTFDEDVRRVKAAGMDGHLGKPYMPEELYRLLARAIKKCNK